MGISGNADVCFVWIDANALCNFLLENSSKMGAKKDPKAGSKAPAKAPKKKEGGGGGKAKKKNPRQIEQLGLVRQAYLRQTVERSSNLQTYHTFDCERKIKGPWILGPQGFARTCPERS